MLVENFVGLENVGVLIVMSGFDFECVMIVFLCLGVVERVLELFIDYVWIW